MPVSSLFPLASSDRVKKKIQFTKTMRTSITVILLVVCVIIECFLLPSPVDAIKIVMQRRRPKHEHKHEHHECCHETIHEPMHWPMHWGHGFSDWGGFGHMFGGFGGFGGMGGFGGLGNWAPLMMLRR
jgi:hypothetical protein